MEIRITATLLLPTQHFSSRLNLEQYILFIKSIRENGTMDTGKAIFFGLKEL
jgi:hypothetical protein